MVQPQFWPGAALRTSSGDKTFVDNLLEPLQILQRNRADPRHANEGRVQTNRTPGWQVLI
jgi:hypothetical protein